MAIIEVKDLVKRYGDRMAVDGVSFEVEPGEIFGILGPNGAGKTTTVECIEGLRRPDEGSIRVLDIDPQDDPRRELKHRLGAQLQDSELPEKLTVREALELYHSFYRDPPDWSELAETLGLRDKLNDKCGKLSGGQKQRLAIALALIGKPQVAVLDELTTGLDPQARRDVWGLIEQIRNSGVTILLVTHFMAEAERLCDRLALIDSGKIVAIDSPAGLVSRVDDEQRIRFRPSGPLDDTLLTALPEVTAVSRSGRLITVTGKGNVVHAVTAVLARNQIIATELRVEQTTLDDAFIALTGRQLED